MVIWTEIPFLGKFVPKNQNWKNYSSKESNTTLKTKDSLCKRLSRPNAAPLTQTELEEKQERWRTATEMSRNKEETTIINE